MSASGKSPLAAVLVKFAVGAAVLAVLLFAVWSQRQPPGREPAPVPGPRGAPPPAAQPAVEPAAGATRTSVSDPAADEATRSPAPATHEGWRAQGSVRAAAGSAPVAGARVDLWLRHTDGSSTPLGRATSAADGVFVVGLDRLTQVDAAQLATARVEGRIEAAGFQPFAVSVPLASAVEKRVALDARLVEGAAVRGRAVDSDKKPVPRATAAISVADGRSGPGGLTLVAEGEADADGLFALGFPAAGKLFLTVRADGVGVHAKEIEVEARRDRDVGDVVLKGGPPLAGVVLYADDTPAPLLELWALEGETAFKPDAFESAVRRAREVERDDAGLSWSRTFTDAQGRFAFHGLRPDHFSLKAADPAIVIEPRQGRWEPGQTNVQLQVQTPLLVVRVIDESGAAMPGALVEVTDLGVEADGAFTPGGTRRVVARGSSASASFSADPETPMAVRARLRGKVAPEKIVFFGQGTQHLEETLVLAPRPKPGSLRFTVAGTEASKVSLRVALASPATGQRDEDLGVLEADALGVVAGVPAGDYQLVVDFAGEAGAWFFPWKSRTAVHVVTDAETAVVVEPVVGARLAIRCELSGPPPKGYDESKAAAARRDRFGARFVLVPVGGGQERTLDLRLGAEDAYLLVPGETAEARDLLNAGDFIVRVEGTPWMPTETRIRLTAGRRFAATIDVRAR